VWGIAGSDARPGSATVGIEEDLGARMALPLESKRHVPELPRLRQGAMERLDPFREEEAAAA
jgi:hypothetical protein